MIQTNGQGYSAETKRQTGKLAFLISVLSLSMTAQSENHLTKLMIFLISIFSPYAIHLFIAHLVSYVLYVLLITFLSIYFHYRKMNFPIVGNKKIVTNALFICKNI